MLATSVISGRLISRFGRYKLFPIIGTAVENIDAAGDREQFRALLQKLNLKQPANGIARNVAEAREIAKRIGYPVLVRPHHVLGGRGMHVARSADELRVDGPCLVDRFLEGALELDVDALCDGGDAWVAAVLEHVEPTGVHSGDSACVVPGPSVTPDLEAEIRAVTSRIAKGLGPSARAHLREKGRAPQRETHAHQHCIDART